MPPSLHIVSSCTDGKRGSIAAPHRLGSHPQRKVAERFAVWWAALESADADVKVAATDLYVGDHWSVSRELPALAQLRGWDARLWVLSAGYGLLPADTNIAPYAATFQPRHADSVSHQSGGARNAEHKEWWRLLASRSLDSSTQPRSLTALAQSDPHGIILVVASPPYLLAAEDDLCGAASVLSERGALLLVSSATHNLAPALEARHITSHARLKHLVQGSLLSLHARVARWLIETSAQHQFRMTAIEHMVTDAVRWLPALARHERRPAEDSEVLQFMRTRIEGDPRTSHSRLLREWRGAGRACEQSRFRQLFRHLQEQMK